MTSARPDSSVNVGTWGCLSAGTILLGGFAVFVFEIASGTDYEYKYLGLASVVGGLIIMIPLAFPKAPIARRFSLPALRPWVVTAFLALLIFLLFF